MLVAGGKVVICPKLPIRPGGNHVHLIGGERVEEKWGARRVGEFIAAERHAVCCDEYDFPRILSQKLAGNFRILSNRIILKDVAVLIQDLRNHSEGFLRGGAAGDRAAGLD